MGSSYVQLYLRCRSLLSCKTAASTWNFSSQVHQCATLTRGADKILNGSSFFRGSRPTTGARQGWRSQVFWYSDLTARLPTTKAEEGKFTEELSRADVVAYKSPLVPVSEALLGSESHMLLDLDAAAKVSALKIISDEEAISIPVSAAMPPASNSLRDYVDKSETLSKLVQLGVVLWKLEQRPNAGSMLLRLDFNTDVAPRLLFLKEIGVDELRFGYILTHNPFLLTQKLENLQTRVNYLKSMHFSSEIIASMVSRAPYMLNFSVKRLDNRLGFYQQTLNLSASNTRDIIARLPRLLTSSLGPVKENLKICEIELGFKANEIQHIVLAVPKVLIASKGRLTEVFDLIHNTMKVPHHLINKFPQVMNTRCLRVKERHLFLSYLGKAQYDPNLPNYISLERLVVLPDEAFCTELALASLEDFNLFQKTL